jgi:hypothetical protein
MPSRDTSTNYIVKSFEQHFCFQNINLDEVEKTQPSLVFHIIGIQVFNIGDMQQSIMP